MRIVVSKAIRFNIDDEAEPDFELTVEGDSPTEVRQTYVTIFRELKQAMKEEINDNR